jgi:hypothetical protein
MKAYLKYDKWAEKEAFCFLVFFFSARRKIHRIGSQHVLQIFRGYCAILKKAPPTNFGQ